ncbi:DUF6954 family protein [Bacillus massilinigeriensis]|uniref:DUF6954 family protein n=1 Tax=Bacillus massilionigeriensis TaxID=1805475 RepID=UPI00096B4354|nr:hypothetical protein [Bacillus massilionigeriensis]
MKWLISTIFVLLYLGVTFFGLGPVLLADGSTQERMITLGVVILIYLVLTFILIKWIKRRR